MDYDSRNMLVSSDFPLDKVVFMSSGSISVPPFGFNDVSVPHGLPFIPLVSAVYSTTSDFETTYEYNSGPVQTNTSLPGVFLYDTSDMSTSEHIILRHSNNTASSVTLYYRVYAFMPSTANDLVGFTVTEADDFVMNTDYNYTKLFMSGVTPYSSVANSVEVITHGLGYRPQVSAWQQKPDGVYSVTSALLLANGNTTGGMVSVTDNNIIYQREDFPFGASRLHYRIYIDE